MVTTNTTKTLLLVDDDREFTNHFSEKAQKAGFKMQVAASGKEALDYIEQNNVDIIVLDFILPEMDGYTFYHILTHDMKKNIPTVVLTSLSRLENKIEGLEVYEKSETDLDEFISKLKSRVLIR